MQREFALPGSQAQYAPDRRFDIQHYRIALDLDVDSRSISGVCSVTLTPMADGHRWVTLDAVELQIERVTWGDRSLEFSCDGRQLQVDLGEQTSTGDTIDLDVTYSATPRRGLYFVGPCADYPEKPVQVWSQGQDQDSRYWFPCFDSPHEKATSELIVGVPASFFALSNGALIERKLDEKSGRATFHWQFDTPHSCYLITLAAGEFAELRDRWEDIEVTYYIQHGREEDCRRTLARTPEMLQLFSEKFGVRYPYNKYAQVFVADFIFGGMENTTATTLTDVVLLDERAKLDTDMDDLVAHELAHQWFGDLLTCRDWGHGWLNEGFATYSEYIWREHAEGVDAAAMELDEWGEQYYREDAKRYRRPVATNLYDEPIDVFDHHLYDKGGRILHMLRRALGDDLFWKSIGHYTRKHRTGLVETRDLARAVEDATGRVLDWFFDQWILKGAGHPELEVSYSWQHEKRVARFTIKQVQKVEGETPMFRLPMQVRFRIGESQEDVDFDIELTEAQQTFYFPLDGEPTQAILDPGKHVLAQLKVEKGVQLWVNQLEAATNAIDRVHAARNLARVGGRTAEQALIRALQAKQFWGARGAAATALGAIRSVAARDALIRAIGTTADHKARRCVVRALGEFRNDEVAADALVALIEAGDPSYFVEAEACLALGKTRSQRAPTVLRSVLDRDSFNDVIRQFAYRGMAEARDDGAIPTLLEATSYGRVSAGRRAALTALAQFAQGRRDRQAREILDRCVELLRDPDFRVLTTAIESLAMIGDPSVISDLREAVESALDGRIKRRGREVIRDLAESSARNEQIEALRSELEALRAESIALRQRVDDLHANGESRAMATARAAPMAPRTLRRTGGKKTVPKRR